jgi:adenosine kinase
MTGPGRIVVTGSIATDHLMVFPGRFADQLISDRLERVSLSFLADRLDVRRGGVAANIAFGLARLGADPVLVGAAGADFGDYRAWLEAAGVDTASVRVSDTLHTARFVCTTDVDQNQIATFYSGAMAEARRIRLADLPPRIGRPELVVVSPNDPEAMLRHTDECRELGLPFAADPSQQLARLDGAQVVRLIRGADLLFVNDYEAALIAERTGWSEQQLLEQVGTWVTTIGSAGVVVARAGEPRLHVPAVETEVLDPTGGGDAFRAGFLAAVAGGLAVDRATQLGCALAAVVLESVGTQEYRLSRADLVLRVDRAYGCEAAGEIEKFLR